MIKVQEIIDGLFALASELNDPRDISVTFREWDGKFDVSVDTHFLMPEDDGGTYWETETDTDILTRREALNRIASV